MKAQLIEFLFVVCICYMIVRTLHIFEITGLLVIFLGIHLHQQMHCWRAESRLFHSVGALVQLWAAYRVFQDELYDVTTLLVLGALNHILAVIHKKSMLEPPC